MRHMPLLARRVFVGEEDRVNKILGGFQQGQQAQLAERPERDLQTVAVWRLKEALRALIACWMVAQASEFFQSWQQRVKELGNVALQKAAEMFARHWPGLAADIEYRGTNALAKSLNTQIYLFKAKARGFRRTISLSARRQFK
jgi:transposase